MNWLDDTRGVVFDLDDTLLDHAGAVVSGLHAWLHQLGVDPTAENVALWQALEAKHWALRRAGVHTFQGQRRARVLEFLTELGRPCPDPSDLDGLDGVFAGFLAQYETRWAAFPDVHPTVKAIRAQGIEIAILTNGTQDQQSRKVAAIGLSHLRGRVLTAEGLGFGKPQPAAYLAAAELLELPPAQVLHVGDSQDLDVTAAEAAGLQAVLVDRSGRQPTAAQRVTSLTQLLKQR